MKLTNFLRTCLMNITGQANTPNRQRRVRQAKLRRYRRLVMESFEPRIVLDGSAFCAAEASCDSALIGSEDPPGAFAPFVAEDVGEGEGPTGSSGATVSIAPLDADKVEGDSGSTTFTFNVTLAGDVPGGFDVHYETSEGSASAGGLYVDFHEKLLYSEHFNGTDGETKTISITVYGDNVVEVDETFNVLLGDISGVASGYSVSVAVGSALATIQNDDSAILTIDDPGEIAEGDLSGTIKVQHFTLNLSAPVQDYGINPLTVNYSVQNITTKNEDWEDWTSGSIAMESHLGGFYNWTWINIEIVDDLIAERHLEDYQIGLSSVSANGLPVTLGTGNDIIGTATIVNNDTATVSITSEQDNVSTDPSTAGLLESNDSFNITVNLSREVDVPVTVHYLTMASSKGTAATAGVDFNGVNKSFEFAAYETTHDVPITLNPDAIVEGNEWFKFAVDLLTSPMGWDVKLGSNIYRDIEICDDDYAEITISNAEATEPTAGWSLATFTVTLTNAVAVPVSITVSTLDGTATNGTDSDYLANSQTITFMPGGDATYKFVVRVYHDSANNEEDEDFFATLSALDAGDLSYIFVTIEQVDGADMFGTGVIHES